MQAKARGRKEKEKSKEKDNNETTGTAEQPADPVESNQTEEQKAQTNKSGEVANSKEVVEEQQQLDPDL